MRVSAVCVVFLLAACGDEADPDTLDTGPAEVEDVEVEDVEALPDVDPEVEVDPDVGPDVVVDPTLRVVSLNLRCLIDDWDTRLPILVDGLAAVDPQLMGLQEACAERDTDTRRDNVAELVAALSARTGHAYEVHRVVTHRAWDTYDEGLAIVSALPMTDLKSEGLPGGTFPRKVLLARVVVTDATTLVFGTTHLDHLSAPTRKLQATRVVAVADTYRKADEAFVLTGDFNEGPSGGEVHSTLTGSGLVDLWATMHPGDPGPTFPASNPAQRIDAVWLEVAGSGLVIEDIHRILTEAVGGVYGSDHLGLAATFGR